jgi:hypothetical protein
VIRADGEVHPTELIQVVVDRFDELGIELAQSSTEQLRRDELDVHLRHVGGRRGAFGRSAGRDGGVGLRAGAGTPWHAEASAAIGALDHFADQFGLKPQGPAAALARQGERIVGNDVRRSLG